MRAAAVVTEQHSLIKLQWVFRCLIALCALIICWNARFQNNPDGVSILDMGDQYWSGNWHDALNSYWSPLYGWLTGFMFRMTKPTVGWEYPEVHFLNFLLFLAALCSFESFWRELMAARREDQWTGTSRQYSWAAGYLLFISLYLGSRMLEHVNPDLLVSTLVLLVFGMMLRFSSGRASTFTAASLGVVLGIGYLAKAAMLPFGAIVLMTLLALVWRRRDNMLRAGLAILTFLLISVPFITALSWNSHRITTGDSGKLNVAWNVNGVNGSTYEYRLWQSDGGASAYRQHPVRKIMSWPEVYEFATPVSGTYPVWYDPTYWWEGVDTKMHPVREVVTFIHSLGRMTNYLIREIGILTAVALMMFFLSDRVRGSWKNLKQLWPILIPTSAVFMMYALVVWLPRYTTGVMLTGFCSLVASAESSQEEKRAKMLLAASVTLAVAAVVSVPQAMFQNYHDEGFWARQVDVARQLQVMGIAPSERVAIMGDGFDDEIWARLIKAEIVAEVPHTLATGDSASAFWNSSSLVEEKVLDALKSTGAKAVVAEAPAGDLPAGWARLGNTGHAVFFIR